MAGVNKVMLVGHLGRDPEVRYTTAGTAVASFTLATSRSWTDKQGQRQEKTQWHRIVVWDKLAEICGAHLAKGRQVYIEGELQTRDWMDKENNKRQTTEVRALDVQFLGAKEGGGAGGGGMRRPTSDAGNDSGGGGGGSRFQGGGGGGGGGHESSQQQDYGPPPGDDDVPF